MAFSFYVSFLLLSMFLTFGSLLPSEAAIKKYQFDVSTFLVIAVNTIKKKGSYSNKLS